MIHAATETVARKTKEAPLEMFSTLAAGTEHVLEFAATHGTRKFLLTSSGAVYGKQPAELTHVPESFAGAPDPLDTLSVYGEGKRISELLCAIYQKRTGIECKIARCWAFCGPHLPLDAHFAIGNFIGDVLAGRHIQIAGDGTPRRSYCMRPISQSGCGRSCFAPQVSFLSMWGRRKMSVFWNLHTW